VVVVVVVVVVVFVVVGVGVGEVSGTGTPRTTRSRSVENAPEARIVADEPTVAASGLPTMVRKLCGVVVPAAVVMDGAACVVCFEDACDGVAVARQPPPVDKYPSLQAGERRTSQNQ
jgi:hypothetical protein